MALALRQNYPTTYVASNTGTLLPELNRLGGTHFQMPLATKNPFKILYNAVKLSRLIRNHHIDLVHARSRAPAWSALLASKLTKVPLVTTYHGAYQSTNVFKNLYNSVMTRGDRVIAISDFILNTIHKNHSTTRTKTRLIREGIDLDEFDPNKVKSQDVDILKKEWNIPSEAIIFLLPGRISRLKGQTIFIDAIRRLNNPKIVGVILGQNQENSPYPAEVRRLADGLPIRLIPYITKPRLAYAAADFIISASLVGEAFGRVAAEAGAMERIIIGTNFGATTELCQAGKTGFLVPPGDTRALADAMIQALKLSPDERLKMEKAARGYIVKNFSLQRMCSETIDLYKELVDE